MAAVGCRAEMVHPPIFLFFKAAIHPIKVLALESYSKSKDCIGTVHFGAAAIKSYWRMSKTSV